MSFSASDAAHLLSRLAFGPRPGESDRVATLGLDAWLRIQLDPMKLADPAGDAALAPFAAALAPPADLEDAVQAQQAADAAPASPGAAANPMTMAKRELLLETQMTVLARAVASERQLLEVMTDFWTNHFSVSLQKGRVRFLAADFVEKAIRPNALGSFGDLLAATARHPAMLVYLDNAQSVAPRPGSRPAQNGRGLNENYARELLELHTLGVGGGYSQTDVIEVARVLSGWGIDRGSGGTGGFAFHPRFHDDGVKVVMGTAFPAGAGVAEGNRLLQLLAAHPATIQHLCTELCSRLVADVPPKAAVGAAAAAWTKSGGNIAAVVRAIATSPAFWSASVRASKLKSPLELVVSAVRALDGQVDGDGLAKVMVRLGQPPLLAPAPTGYSDASAAWLSTAGALERMNVALGLASGKIRGAKIDLDRLLPLPGTEPIADWRVATLARLAAIVALAAPTRAVIGKQLAAVPAPAQARILALALTLASPEFQRQ